MKGTTRSVQEPVKEALKVERRIDLAANRLEIDAVPVFLNLRNIVIGADQYHVCAYECFNQWTKERKRSAIELALHEGKNALVEVEGKGPMCEEELLAVSSFT